MTSAVPVQLPACQSGAVGASVQTTCPYCGVGCGMKITVQDTANPRAVKVQVLGDTAHPANFGKLCVKGSAAGETLDFSGRMLVPQVKGKTVSWAEAIATVAEKFLQVIAEHGPDAVAFYVSGQFLTEDYYVANKLMKGFIGSANIDTNSRLCMASAVVGYKRAFGADAVPCCYEDLELADLILLIGSNTAWAHPIVYQRIAAAKKRRPEMKVVVVDPRLTATCDLADLHLPIAPGTDAVLMNGVLAHLAQQNALDEDFIAQHTQGFQAALNHAQILQGDANRVAESCGLSLADLQQFYQWVQASPKMVSLYSQGVNQSSSGVDKSNAIINLHLATGRIGKAGMGPFSITGQPNAMGGREVGGLANQLAAHMDFSQPESIELVQRFWQAPKMAQKNGLKAVEMFQAVGSGKIKAIWILNTNPVVSMPDAEAVRQALQACEMVVVSDCMQHTDTTEVADVLLPALTWGEIDGTVTNSDRTVSRQRAFMSGPENARADWWMLCEVAKCMGFDGFDYSSVAQIFREHAALSGFENNGQRAFDLSGLAHLTNLEYQNLQPMQWPVNRANPQGTQRLFADGCFYTASGKAQFIAITPQFPKHRPDADFPLVLNTGRFRDQWHTMTRTGKTAKLMAHRDEITVAMHPKDAEKFGLQDQQLVALQGKASRDYRLIARLEVTSQQASGQVFVPMHWNRQFASAGKVDALIPAVTDPLSGQPETKHAVVKVEAFHARWQGVILSRQVLDLTAADYWSRVTGKGFHRYELAIEAGSGSPLDSQKALASWFESLGEPDAERQVLRYQQSDQFRFAVLSGNRLQAVGFIGKTLPAIERTWLGERFAQALEPLQRRYLLAGKMSGAQDAGPILCSCFEVGLHTLQEAIVRQELTSLEAIGQALKAGTNCGSCVPELKAILAQNLLTPSAV
ncbi:MAG: molybdopterin-dependent oxidoreductase [Thiotrichales bacterium]|nr:molybdopterin-dependent oxidoreductase [Thiotrichales bacterium]